MPRSSILCRTIRNLFKVVVFLTTFSYLVLVGGERPGLSQQTSASLPVRTQDSEFEAKIKVLIDQLADSDFSVRESAYQKLLELGDPALELLKAQQRAPDSEVRFRIKRLVRLIEIRGLQQRIQTIPGIK